MVVIVVIAVVIVGGGGSAKFVHHAVTHSVSFFVSLSASTHLYKRPCPSVGRSVCLGHATVSSILRKTTEFIKNRCSLGERATDQGSLSIN